MEKSCDCHEAQYSHSAGMISAEQSTGPGREGKEQEVVWRKSLMKGCICYYHVACQQRRYWKRDVALEVVVFDREPIICQRKRSFDQRLILEPLILHGERIMQNVNVGYERSDCPLSEIHADRVCRQLPPLEGELWVYFFLLERANETFYNAGLSCCSKPELYTLAVERRVRASTENKMLQDEDHHQYLCNVTQPTRSLCVLRLGSDHFTAVSDSKMFPPFRRCVCSRFVPSP